MPHLKLAGLELKEQTVASLDMQSMLRKTGWHEVVGILGYDFISRFVIKVDYANRVMAIFDPAAFNYSGKGQILGMPLRSNKPMIRASVEGKFSGMWQVDIGAGNCDFMYPFAERSGFLERQGIERTSVDAGGMCTDRDVQFKSFELGGFAIERPIISFPTANVSGGFRDTESVGNLGNDILRHFIVWFDYGNQRMILEKGADFSKKFPYDKSGISAFFNSDDLLEVKAVSANTPGAEAGIKIQDIILAINHTKISYPDGRRIFKDLMAAEEGTKYKVSIKRGQQVLDIDLVLHELYDK
jgi:hypothetical protein